MLNMWDLVDDRKFQERKNCQFVTFQAVTLFSYLFIHPSCYD